MSLSQIDCKQMKSIPLKFQLRNWHSHAKKLWSSIMSESACFPAHKRDSFTLHLRLVASHLLVHIKQPSNGKIKFDERQPNEEWRPISRRARALARAFLWNLTTRNWLIFHAEQSSEILAAADFSERGGICQTPASAARSLFSPF